LARKGKRREGRGKGFFSRKISTTTLIEEKSVG